MQIIKVSNKHFRTLEPVKLQIVDIYPSYRSGWNEVEHKFKNFYSFPDSVTQDVVFQGEEKAELQEGERTHFRLEEWDNDVRKFKFTRVPTIDLKMYKKVFDIDVVADKPTKVLIWSKEEKKEVTTVVQPGEVMRLVGLPATRIQGIATSMMMTKGIEKVEAMITDRLTGERKKEMRLPFDWEDGVVEKMVGTAFEFAVNGTGMDTRYAFSKCEPFHKEEDDGKLFGSGTTTQKPLELSDVPF